jgi:hypothetical protein
MQHQEKKLRVDSFASVKSKLIDLHAKQIDTTTSTHFYTQQTGNNVVKLVVGSGKVEIHILKESNGQFSLQKTIPLDSKVAGLNWLKEKNYHSVGVVNMAHADYAYKGGVIGLYTIDDFLHSVILNFPPGQHEVIQQELGLESTEVISVPYDKYLRELDRLRIIPCNKINNDINIL